MNRARSSALLHFLTACATVIVLATQPELSVAASASDHGLDFAGMDRAVAPGDDFFRFANGGWLARTEIPPDRSTWGTDAELAELTLKRTADLIRAADV